jgi:hypothetical protein
MNGRGGKPFRCRYILLKSLVARLPVLARMVIAATLTMLVCVTFRVPYSFQGAIYALLISRETLVEDTLWQYEALGAL